MKCEVIFLLHIAVCDDEKNFIASLDDLLQKYAAQTDLEIKVTPFYDGSELVEKYDTTFDLIFLDIQMNQMNGLKAAERIRQMDEEVSIIFLTTLTQYSLEGYKYQATNYIIKPIKYARLKAEMDKWRKRRPQGDSPYLAVSSPSGKYRIFLKTLHYIETFNRSLLLHTEQENIICSKSMKEMEQALRSKGFARCHTSYIVNLFFVKGVKKLEIELITGEIIPISQPKRKEFMEQLADYWGDFL